MTGVQACALPICLIGTGVLGGTISATALGLFFVPMFYVLIKRLFKDKTAAPEVVVAASTEVKK